MTPQISKEAMEKAAFIADNLPPATIDALLGGGYETRDALIDILAIEFTAYQKRIEELENLLWQTRSFVGECADCSMSGASMCAATELYPKIEAALKCLKQDQR
jgi:hypothetical protein